MGMTTSLNMANKIITIDTYSVIIKQINYDINSVVVLTYGQGGQLPIPKFLVPLIGEGVGNEECYSQLKPNYKSTVAHTKM